MFKARLLSGIVLVILSLMTIISGGDILLAALFIISVIGMTELYKILHIHKTPLGAVGYMAAAGYYILLYFQKSDMFPLLVVMLLTLAMTIFTVNYPRYRIEQIMAVLFSFLYVAVMLSYVYRTRMLDQGDLLVWLVMLSSWGCDTCAYCIGSRWGKHQLTPVLSPKKTVEGAIGGVLGAAILGCLYAVAIRFSVPDSAINILAYGIICTFGSVISQLGDLAASAIKRNYGIKDFGHLIPGHGGVLDRFDSVIFAAPVIYYVAAALL